MFSIREFEWDDANAWKPEKHGVKLEEVEEVFFNFPLVRKARDERRIAYGQTDAGRYLVVIFVVKDNGVIRPITARDMDQVERRLFKRRG